MSAARPSHSVEIKVASGSVLVAYANAVLDGAVAFRLTDATGAAEAVFADGGTARCGIVSRGMSEHLRGHASVIWARLAGADEDIIAVGEIALERAA